MQDGAPPHITRCVKDVLKHHFTEERVISRQFLHLRPPRSPEINPCDFWLWGHLRQLNTLRSTVEHSILRFQIVAENDGHHGEPLLL
ncbi:uncharacterized protein TNCV_4571651 [Trichonephila clavipes]|nr:uncharacterized protein TNCV_4571651 [Trichonephila clavipes]